MNMPRKQPPPAPKAGRNPQDDVVPLTQSATQPKGSRFSAWPIRFATQVLRGRLPVHPDRATVLIVSHDASRTGAPIVAQNLAAHLSARYNVIVLCLGGGPLVQSFRDAACEVHLTRRLLPKPLRGPWALRAIAAAHALRFAIVNSAASHPVAPGLTAARIPTVAVIHEFAAYLVKHDRIRRLFDASAAVVFSSELTLQDATRRIGFDPATSVQLLAQGKCVVPGSAPDAAAAESAALTTAMRPHGTPRFVVLGAGTLDFRKGTDLFCTLAAMARQRAPEVPWRFVWIGGSLAGSRDGDFPLYLADQIDRSGVADIVQILPPTPAIETAYDLADLLLLPSRLDPLPNVAIDAMAKGLPVLCFDKATGVADLLHQASLSDACRAPYLDLAAMADQIVALARAPEKRTQVGQVLKAFCDHALRFDLYAERLAELAEAAVTAQADTPKK
jgi:glycosyltransferase involved in cell wall biosynthesis